MGKARLDPDSLKVESFDLPASSRMGKCECCGEIDYVDPDGYCAVCGPVERVEDYRLPEG
jgi:ribosomal protein L37E